MAERASISRRLRAVGLVVLGVAGLVLGTCAVLVNQMDLSDRGEDHVFPLPGTEPLTHDQAVEFARQVLVLDGRDLPNLALQDANGSAAVTQPVSAVDADGARTLTYRHRGTGWDWYVSLKRQEGRVVGYSYHGL